MDVENLITFWPFDVFMRRILNSQVAIDDRTLSLIQRLFPTRDSAWLSHADVTKKMNALSSRADFWCSKVVSEQKWELFGLLQKLQSECGVDKLFFPPGHPTTLQEDGKKSDNFVLRSATVHGIVDELSSAPSLTLALSSSAALSATPLLGDIVLYALPIYIEPHSLLKSIREYQMAATSLPLSSSSSSCALMSSSSLDTFLMKWSSSEEFRSDWTEELRALLPQEIVCSSKLPLPLTAHNSEAVLRLVQKTQKSPLETSIFDDQFDIIDEVSTEVLAAQLTLLHYSLHDVITARQIIAYVVKDEGNKVPFL